MIITVDEFKEMGFVSEDDNLTSDCIKRAEFVLNGLSGGRAVPVSKTGGTAAEYVKQACAFQARAIMREEEALRGRESEDENELRSNVERVAIGDYSYSYSSSSRSDSSARSGSSEYEPLDTNFTVIRLLRAAGCLYTGREVSE